MDPKVNWWFPLTRPHSGVPLGNGKQGVLIWGEERLLLTVARAGFWDHRGGSTIPPGTTFPAVREALETRDFEKLKELFPPRSPTAAFPQQLGGGRIEVRLPEGLRPQCAELELASGTLRVQVGRYAGDAEMHTLHIFQDPYTELSWIEAPPQLLESVRLTPAFDLVHEAAMSRLGIAPPEVWEEAHGGGFEQSLPKDDPLALAWHREGGILHFATALGEGASQKVRQVLREFSAAQSHASRRAFWQGYWEVSASVTLPDPILQQQFDFGLYRQAGMIRQDAPPATLQGPWMEDTRIPTWSNDYHFNINVELVYGAALATGHAADMRPLWDMLRSWIPRLRALGESFYGLPGAMILPHAVDDRCQMMGSFWAGAIDQACVAWMGRMAWQSYDVTGDELMLRDLVWPLLVGAFEGYFAMLEKRTDGTGFYSLPLSVSPEFGGSDPDICWGRNASFQLAALHSTLDILPRVASLLGHAEDPRWQVVANHLPPYTLISAQSGSYGWIGEPRKRIALWENQDLSESHRHHSHLASIYPFCTVDPFDPAHQAAVARSLNHWNSMGAGNWTGWCLPWASFLCSRSGLPDAALSWLHLLAEQFTNEGHATLHNANGSGVFAWDDGSLAWPNHRKGPDFCFHEIMQMDAAVGAVNAILELLVSVRKGVIHIAPYLPKQWRDLSISRVRLEGGFQVDIVFRHGRADSLCVRSSRGAQVCVANALEDLWKIDQELYRDPLLKIPTQPGQILHFQRIDAPDQKPA